MDKQALIIFDMDGVLIDVSGSYRETVRQTARLFFTGARGFDKLPDPLFSLRDLAKIKQSGGLNNDWDLTSVVLNLLFTQVECGRICTDPDPWKGYAETVRHCDVSNLARYLHSTGKTVSALLEENGRQQHEFISKAYSGDVGSGNIIKQIFQEIYLGKNLFKTTYGFSPKVYNDEGFISRESLLIDRSVLDALARAHTLAIATGRPRSEAEYPLAHFELRKYFTAVLTLNDCLEEEAHHRKKGQQNISLSKPNPWMLDAIAEKLPHDYTGHYYVGDMPDDMLAAKRSGKGFVGIGVLVSSPDRESLKEDLVRAGADYIADDFEELAKIVSLRKRSSPD